MALGAGGFLLAMALLLFSNEQVKQVLCEKSLIQQSHVIAIDPGHGGEDSGKVSVNNTYEKDINLQIAGKLKKYLESSDVKVVMTREEDKMLCDAGSQHKKAEDMRNRCSMINQAKPEFTVSIHQNSYTSSEISGAQVFYHTQSKEGKSIAECIQKNLITYLDKENKRAAKGNESYYLLKNTESPTVIVECGFLSNKAEADKLETEAYQDQVAWAIHMSVMEILSKMENKQIQDINYRKKNADGNNFDKGRKGRGMYKACRGVYKRRRSGGIPNGNGLWTWSRCLE